MSEFNQNVRHLAVRELVSVGKISTFGYRGIVSVKVKHGALFLDMRILVYLRCPIGSLHSFFFFAPLTG